MKPAPPETAELLQRVRQQLILAQVRIMELEDERDELTSRRAQLDRTLTGMQTIANDRIAERDHLARLHAGLEKQLGSLHQQLGETRRSLQQEQAREAEGQTALARSESTAAGRQARVEEL
jgi:ABC-type phosphate transport system auxiliary subunit